MGLKIYTDINIRGTVYPDVRSVCRALGVTGETVRIAIRKGTAHRIGTGQVGKEPMPIRVRGVVYDSAEVAAKALGVSVSAIYQALSKDRLDRIGKAQVQLPARRKPVTIAGMTFASMAEADRILGFGHGYVSLALKTGRECARWRMVRAVAELRAREEEKRRRQRAREMAKVAA